MLSQLSCHSALGGGFPGAFASSTLVRSYPTRESARRRRLPAIAPCVKYNKRHDGHRPSSFTLRSEGRHSFETPRDMTSDLLRLDDSHDMKIMRDERSSSRAQ